MRTAQAVSTERENRETRTANAVSAYISRSSTLRIASVAITDVQTAEDRWNGEPSPVQVRVVGSPNTPRPHGRGRRECSAECRDEQKGAYSSRPVLLLEWRRRRPALSLGGDRTGLPSLACDQTGSRLTSMPVSFSTLSVTGQRDFTASSHVSSSSSLASASISSVTSSPCSPGRSSVSVPM